MKFNGEKSFRVELWWDGVWKMGGWANIVSQMHKHDAKDVMFSKTKRQNDQQDDDEEEGTGHDTKYKKKNKMWNSRSIASKW